MIKKANNVVVFTLGLIALAILLMPLGLQKVIPGGPFISIFGEAIPLLFFLISLFLEIKLYVAASSKSRIWILLLMGLTILLIGFILFNNLTFWFNPHARGQLFGR